MIETVEQTMLLAMFLVARMLIVKLFLFPHENGIGANLSQIQRRNLKLFGSVLYNSVLNFCKFTVPLKRTNFRSDDDLVSHSLYSKAMIERSLVSSKMAVEVQNSLFKWLTSLLYQLKEQL